MVSRDLSPTTTSGKGTLTLAASDAPLPEGAWCGICGSWRADQRPYLLLWSLSTKRADAIKLIGEAFARPGQDHRAGWKEARRNTYRVIRVTVSASPGDGAGHGTASTSDQGCSSRDTLNPPNTPETK